MMDWMMAGRDGMVRGWDGRGLILWYKEMAKK